MARELPDLIEAVFPTVGNIVDICINWSVGSPTPVLNTMSPEFASKLGNRSPRHRLMFLIGDSTVTKLLVIPSMTAPALAHVLLLQAAQRPIAEIDCGSREFESADRVIAAARAESASWVAARAAGR